MVQPGQDFGLGHLAGKIEAKHPGVDARPELATVASGQLGQIGAARGLRVELLFAEENVVRAHDHILDHDLVVAFELGIGR